MSDPTGWVAPRTNWLPGQGIANTDLNRMETNTLGIRDWLKQGGEFEVDTVNLPGGEKRGTVYWEKHAQGLVSLRFPELLGDQAVANNVSFSLSPVVAWPTDILVAFKEVYVPCIIMHAGPAVPLVGEDHMGGALEVPYDANTDINIYNYLQNDGKFDENFGLWACFVNYFTTDSAFGTSTTTAAP